MAVNSAVLKAVDWQGVIHEDLMRTLLDISRTPLPWYDWAGDAERSTDIYKSWVEDELAEGDETDAKVDGAGDQAGGDESTGERVGNYVQITSKSLNIGFGSEAVDSVGGIGRMIYQTNQRQLELYRNIEARALSMLASVAPVGDTIAGQTAGMGAALKTNTNRAGSDGGFANGIVAAPTLGTRRTITEVDVRKMLSDVFKSNGNPTCLMGTVNVANAFADFLFDDKARVGVLEKQMTSSGKGQSTSGSMADGMITTYAANNVVVDVVANRRQRTYKDSGGTNDASTLYAFDKSQCGVSFQIKPTATKLLEKGLGHTRTVYTYYNVWYGVEKAHGCIDCINEDTPFQANA